MVRLIQLIQSADFEPMPDPDSVSPATPPRRPFPVVTVLEALLTIGLLVLMAWILFLSEASLPAI